MYVCSSFQHLHLHIHTHTHTYTHNHMHVAFGCNYTLGARSQHRHTLLESLRARLVIHRRLYHVSQVRYGMDTWNICLHIFWDILFASPVHACVNTVITQSHIISICRDTLHITKKGYILIVRHNWHFSHGYCLHVTDCFWARSVRGDVRIS